MFRCRLPDHATVVAYLGLFVALATGGAYAASELGKGDVASKHIKNGGIKNKDIAGNAVTSPKVENGSLLGEDFAAGQLPEGERGPQGEQGIQGLPGTARAYGRVAVDGTLSRSKNIAAVTGVNNANPTLGGYCVLLDPSIEAATAVIVADPDYGNSSTDEGATAFAEPASAPPCGPNGLTVRTGYTDLDTGGNDTDGSTNKFSNQPFFFVVP